MATDHPAYCTCDECGHLDYLECGTCRRFDRAENLFFCERCDNALHGGCAVVCGICGAGVCIDCVVQGTGGTVCKDCVEDDAKRAPASDEAPTLSPGSRHLYCYYCETLLPPGSAIRCHRCRYSFCGRHAHTCQQCRRYYCWQCCDEWDLFSDVYLCQTCHRRNLQQVQASQA